MSKIVYAYGRHALGEALSCNGLVGRVWLASSVDDPVLRRTLKRAGVVVQDLNTQTMPRGIDETVVHQGVVFAFDGEKLVVPFDDFISSFVVTPDTALVLFSEVQDVHNVGAVIRSAAAFGIQGILLPEHNQAPISAASIKVSSGMAFRVPLVRIGNVHHTLRVLKERGFWIYGLSESAQTSITEESFDAPTVFVVGGEHEGVRHKTLEYCDVHLRIPMHTRCDSLNASVSAGLAFFVWSSKHQDALKQQ